MVEHPTAYPLVRDERGVIRAPGALMTDASGDRRAGTGSDWFPTVYDRGIFVDKSMLIKDILMGNQAVLFCRPRRFGKTLAATMLKDFFECAPCADPRARGRFETLSIWEADQGRWQAHQGRYPVVMLSLKEAAVGTWEEVLSWLASLVGAEVERHGYLFDSPALSTYERERLGRLASGTASFVELGTSLRFLCTALERHHAEQCIVILDEYDAPITHAHANGFYQEAVDFMRSWLSGALKTNPSLAFGILTGVQRISKETIFSGLNNIDVNTPLNPLSDERFGFTPEEAAALASYTGHANKTADLRTWYDGYRFGDSDVYNPWSVLSYLSKNCVAQPYWVNTSSNSVLGRAFKNQGAAEVDQLLSLLEPGVMFEQPIDPNIAYGELESRPAALWSVLYMAGYLTTDDTQFPEDPVRLRPLRVPNVEVRSAFRREVVDRARNALQDPRRLAPLHDALIAGDQAAFAEQLQALVLGSASMYDLTRESECHMLLMGLLFGMPGYGDPVSNREAGYGRFDLQVTPLPDRAAELPLLTVEAKFMSSSSYDQLGEGAPAALDELARKALNQIAGKAYDEGHAPLPAPMRWGVAFGGKHVAVAVEKNPGSGQHPQPL